MYQSVASYRALFDAVVSGNGAARDQWLAQGVTFVQMEAHLGTSQGITSMLHAVVNNGHEDMLRWCVADSRVSFSSNNRYLLGEAVRCDRRRMVDLLLPLVTQNTTLEHAVLCSIDTGDRLGRLVAILNQVKNSPDPAEKDQQWLSHREYFATHALIRALWNRQSDIVATLLAHTEVQPDYDHGKPLREAVAYVGNEPSLRLLVPRTNLEQVRAHCAKKGEWATLDQLTPFIPAEVAENWAKRHRHLTETRARHRQEQALATPPPTRPRHRRRA